MVLIATAALLILGFVAAQDADCNYNQYIGPQNRYYIDNNYYAGRKCRYILNCSPGYNCRADCFLYMPYSNGCALDSFLVSRSGDPNLNGAERYCGRVSLTVISNANALVLGLSSSVNSPGGRVQCNLTSQLAPTTTPPPEASCRCGEKKTVRIVGGQETKPNEYTMMAALVENSTKSIHCGAVIISQQHTLTAAHCVNQYTNNVDRLVVVVDVHNLYNGEGERYQIARFIVHERFNSVTYDYDLAVTVLLRLLIFNANVQPVCLPFSLTNTDLTGLNVTLLGWGLTSNGGMLPDSLRETVVRVISRQQCAATESNITERQICTFARGKDGCQYDSGGPVLYLVPSNGLLYVVGIISYGSGCASARPGVQTYVALRSLLQWIIDNCRTNFCRK